MPTYWTKTLIPTLRQAPADAEVPSHRLMLRGALVRKVGAGSYTYLPLGWRVVQRVSRIIREEMDAAGASEIFMPTLHPIDLWQRSGRRVDYGENLFVLQDRHQREYALGPTHEEVTTDLIGSMIESYKDLPKTVYQIQTKFRDEFRPRFGVLRSREFIMKDAYSFHLNLEGEGGLDETYQKQYEAYCRIFERCGVNYEIVEAESGPIGGSASHEFMVPTPTGEDVILKSTAPREEAYAANVEKCEIGPREISPAFVGLPQATQVNQPASDKSADPTGQLEVLHTPDCPGIEDVCTFFKKNLGSTLKPKNMLKTLVCKDEDSWALAVVRGDHTLNQAKLGLPLADETQAKQAGFAIGFVGPQLVTQREDLRLIVDPDTTCDQFWVTGANKADHHLKHFHWKRDVLDPLGSAAKDRVLIADIRNAEEGDPDPHSSGQTMYKTRGIEVGHVFKLGDKYTKALGVSVLDEHNNQRTPLMGCYGIGVNRIVAAAIEAGHDDDGIIWPAALAPYDILLTPLGYNEHIQQATNHIISTLENQSPPRPRAGSATPTILIDDRDLRPGVKFKDADLIGIPLRITIGDKGLSASPPSIELKARNGSLGPKGESVPLNDAPQRIAQILRNQDHQ